MNRPSRIARTTCKLAPALVLVMFSLVSDALATDKRLLKPLPAEPPLIPKTRLESKNPIDHFLAAKWAEAGVRPTYRCDDYTFIRRIYLDLAGVIPTAEAVQAFVKSRGSRRREQEIDKLLESNRYAEHWGIMWEDLLRVKSRLRGTEVNSFRRYIQEELNQNRPYDEWVREMIVASGTAQDDPAVNFVLRHQNDANDLTISVTQVFMGMQLKCVQCHDDRNGRFWKQADFEGMASFWKRTRIQPAGKKLVTTPQGPREIAITKVVDHRPSDGTFLGHGQPAEGAGREALADFVTSPSNPYFARAVVNRIWKQMMGSGLVEPVDDLDPINDASHPELLDWLALDFIGHGYDLKHVIRLIANSRAYQTESVKFRRSAGKRADRLFDAMPLRRMTAEQLLDSILVCCGLLNDGNPGNRRAIKNPYPAQPGGFLATFGAHDRETIHQRDPEATIPQALELLNGRFINLAVAGHDGNPLRGWLRQGTPVNRVIELLYLNTLSRKPSRQEKSVVRAYLKQANFTTGWSDVLWAVINTREFMFVR